MAKLHAIDYLAAPDKHSPKPVCVAYGDDLFLRRQVLLQLRHAVLGDDEGDVSLTNFEGAAAELRDVVEELDTVAMFGPRRLVVVDDADAFVTRYREALEGYVAKSGRSGILLLDVKSWPATTRLYKAVDAQGLAVDCGSPVAAKLTRWLCDWAKQTHKVQLSLNTAEMLMEHVGPELGLLDQELAKLALLTDADTKITPDLIQKYVGGWRAKTTWEMLDLAMDGNVPEALRQIDRLLASGEVPIGLLGMISSSLRRLAAATRLILQAETAGRKIAVGPALQKAGVKPFVMQKAERQLRRLGRQRGSQLYRWLLETDLDLKGASQMPPRLVLERLIVRLAAPAQLHTMTPDEFRRHGREVIDWITDYMERVEQLPVLAQVKPGEVRGRLPEHPPQQGEPFEEILKDVNDVILPGVTHWQSPNFFAYLPCNNSGPSILGELLSAGLGVQGMLWSTSPACTELETLVLDWLVEAPALPVKFRSTGAGGGVIQDTASSATLCAILAARDRSEGRNEQLVAYASSQTHSSIEKDLHIAGLSGENFRRIEVACDFAMRPDSLAEAIAADVAAGRKPFFVCATTGTTSSLAFDPLRAIGEICRQHGIWLHVDAAMAGTAAICPEFRAMHDGLELADSYCFNPHKWMFTNFDCCCFFVADRGPLIRALGILPEYLKNQATNSGEVIDYRDWQIPLGRRFRALKLWFVLRSFGIEGIQDRIRRHVAIARELAGWIAADARFELAAPANLNLVCFRHRAGDEATQRLDRVNTSGKLFISHTRLDGRLTLRFCVGQTNTERRHVEAAWEEIRKEE